MPLLAIQPIYIFSAALLFACAGIFNFAPVFMSLLAALALAVAALGMPARALPQTPRETATAETSENMQAILEALPDPCLIVGNTGEIQAFNSVAKNLAPQLAKGTPLSFHLRNPLLNDAVAQALNGLSVLIEMKDSVPIERWFTVSAMPLAYSTKPMACVMLHDETPQKRGERMRADFVANASHELRTPLASISGFIETLQGPARNDETSRAHFLSIMQFQALRMSRLIDDLLSLSRVEMHQHILPEHEVDLVTLLQSVIATLSPLAVEEGIVFHFSSETEDAVVRGDRDELIRVFENLMENAVKYGGDGKKIDVSVSHARDEKCYHVTVKDYGAGIAEQHLPRLTERFYRADESHSREKGGTGLGLALVKHIVNRHRGMLEITSQPGKGASFKTVLPAAF